MITLTKLSLRFKRTTIALALVVLVAGVWGALQLKQELMPNIEFPVASAIVRWPGHSAEEVMEHVTIPLEEAANRVPGVTQVQSVSSAGFALAVVQTDFGYSSADVSANLGAQVEKLTLPDDAEPPEVLELNMGEMPVIQVSASSDMPLSELQVLVEEQVVPDLKQLDGVGDVEVSGGVEMETAPAVGLPLSWVMAGSMGGVAIETTADVSPPIILGILEQRPEMLNELTPDMLLAFSPEAVAALPESYVAGLDVELQAQLAEIAAQISQVTDSPALSAKWQERGIKTAADLTPNVIGQALAFDPASLSDLSDEVLLALSPEASAAIPPTVLQGRDETIVATLLDKAASAAPEATINRTNGRPSLSISVRKTRDANTVGVVHTVEDRLEEMGTELSGVHFDTVLEQASFIEESIAGVSREGVLGALFAVIVILVFLNFSVRSTLVTAVSIPLSVLAGFALTKLGGLTLNMMTLSGMTVAVGRVVDDSIVVLENIYRHIQRGEDRYTAVVQGTRDVARAIFASTLTTIAVFLPLGLVGGLISEVFLPFALTVTFALAASYVVAITIVPLLAYLFIRQEHLKEAQETWMQRLYTPLLQWSLHHRVVTLLVAFGLLIFSLSLARWIPLSFMPSVGEPTIQISLSMPPGTTMAGTDQVARQIEGYLVGLEDVETFSTIVGSGEGGGSFLGGGEGGVDPRQAFIEVIPADGNLEQLTQEIRAYVEGQVDADTSRVTSQDMASGVMGGFDVVLTADNYEDLAAANQMALEALNGQEHLVNVSSDLPVAQPGQSLSLISRINGKLATSFSAEVTSKDLMRINAEALKMVADLSSLPEGVDVMQGSGTQMQNTAFADMGQSMMVAIIVVYLVMALTFRSPVHPFTILFSLPLAAIGAMVALFLSGSTLGLSAMIGMLMLIGIVVTNAIVLIERVQQNRVEQGMNAYDALIEAGRTRLRPIWMTAIAAVLALMPLAMGFTEGAIIATELAIVVIGGLLTSTFLTTLVVPVVYSLLDQLGGWLARRVNRRTAAPVTRE